MSKKPLSAIVSLALLTLSAAGASRFVSWQTKETAATEATTKVEAEVDSRAGTEVKADSVKPRFKVSTTTAQSVDDTEKAGADLKNPENLKTDFWYDEKTGTYRLGTKLGDYFLEAPFAVTKEEYDRLMTLRSLRHYYRQKTAMRSRRKAKTSLISPICNLTSDRPTRFSVPEA